MNINFPETPESLVQFAILVGFIGMGFGSIIGVCCRAVISVVNIFHKITK